MDKYLSKFHLPTIGFENRVFEKSLHSITLSKWRKGSVKIVTVKFGCKSQINVHGAAFFGGFQK